MRFEQNSDFAVSADSTHPYNVTVWLSRARRTPGTNLKFLTYWGGIRNGILNLKLNREMVPPDVCRLVDAVKQLMQRGNFSPFIGPLTDRYGKLRLSEGYNLDYEQIVAMDYLVEGLEGPPVDPKKVVVP